MARKRQLIYRPGPDESFVKTLDRIIRYTGFVLLGIFFFGTLWHFHSTGSIERGFNQLKYMVTYFKADNSYKNMMSQSYQDAIEEKLLLDSLYHGDLSQDSIYHFTHEIFGSYLDNKSKRIVTIIIERSDLTLMEKIKHAEEELQKDFFTNREKELFRQRFAEIAKLFFLLNDESDDNKLEAGIYMINLESFNPMDHYNTIKSIIDFTFHYTNEVNIGELTRALLLDRAYGDHVMQEWELEGFHDLQAEEVDSSFQHLHQYIQKAKYEKNPELIYNLINDFAHHMSHEDFSIFNQRYPQAIRNMLLTNMKLLYEESVNLTGDPKYLVVSMELLLEIGKLDERFYRKNIKLFNSFIESLDDLDPVDKDIAVDRLRSIINKINIQKLAVNEKYFLDKIRLNQNLNN